MNQLSKNHGQKLAPTVKFLDFVIPIVTGNTFVEFVTIEPMKTVFGESMRILQLI